MSQHVAEFSGEIVILGINHAGRKFRPSYWAEKLAGNLARFGNGHGNPASWVQPALRGDTACLVVSRGLERADPGTYQILMDFARDHDLQLSSGRSVPRDAAVPAA